MRASLRDNAPALLLVAASAILMVAFSLPIGAERLARTHYQRLEGFVGAFEAKAAPAAAGAATAGGETWGLVAQAVRQRYTPIEANALLDRVESLSKSAEKPAAPARPKAAARKPRVLLAAAVASSSSTAKTDPALAPVPATPPETADSVEELYDNDGAKYPMDASAAQGSVSLRLMGLSRAGGRCLLKVSVSNRGGEDFFVRELVLRDGQEVLGSKSFIRLFVEPGRTREGLVVFERPRKGTAVHVALKEDKEKGRVVELAVPYPF